MHHFMRRKHSTVGLILLGIVVPAILAVHIFSFNFLRSADLNLMYLLPIGVAAIVLTGLHAYKLSHTRRSTDDVNEADIVARNGLHWHPEISIYAQGVKQEIPQMGITNMDTSAMHAMHAMHKRMQSRHMLDGPNEQGIIHLKFEGIVRKNDIALGRFFEKWGKEMHSLGTTVKMTVNGMENTEYENYIMQDQDKIELRYE